MATEEHAKQFSDAGERLQEMRRRLGALFGSSGASKPDVTVQSGLLGSLGELMDQLGKLASDAHDAGGAVTRRGEFTSGPDKQVRGVYGFSVKVGLGEQGGTVEPFGNIRKDARSGHVEVQEIREPMTDLFDEPTHVLIVAEVPGVTQEDVRVELHDDILTLVAERGEKKYRKEMLLPTSFSSDKMSYLCRSGIVEIHIDK